MLFGISRSAIAIVCCTGLFVSSTAWGTDDGVDYSGEYIMQGKGFEPSDSAYLGTCSLRRDKHGYRVSCFNQDTRHTYVGKALAQGDTLVMFIGDVLKGDHNQSFVGEYLVAYKRQPDGNLTGTWLHAESQAAGAETLTKKK